MTTDAFSLNFSFEDEKNASTPPPAVPNPSENTDTDSFLAQEGTGPEIIESSTLSSDDNSTENSFDFDSLEIEPQLHEAKSEETAFGDVDASDPFAGYSFGFESGDTFLDDLPTEVTEVNAATSQFDLDGEDKDGVSLSAEQTFEPEVELTTSNADFPETEDFLASAQTDSEQIANQEQSFFLESPEFFGNNDVESQISDITETPVNLDESIEAQDLTTEDMGLLEEEVEPIVLVTPVKIAGNLDANDPFAPFLKAPPHVATVAILGASGIGTSHGKWFSKHGCHVVSFLGTSEESNAATSEKLKQEFGFDGQSYTNLERLLEDTRPEIVCVATPSAFHFVHALESLESGAHVLCEKPLTYAPARKIRENLAGATELIKTAKKKNLLLGTQLQYGAATPILTKLAGVAPEEVGDFAMEIETTNPSAPRDPHQLWIDLGPHAVSIAAFLGGEGAILQEDSVQFFPRIEGQSVEASARFSIRREDGRFITVRAITRYAPKEAMWHPPYRRFSFNGRVVSYRGYQTPTGEFAAQFTAPDGYDSHYPDPVDFIVGNFVRAVAGEEELLIDGEFGRQNLEWLLKINS